MLEIKNLVKVYKTKGGAEVRALDDVSVRFEEKGMIFLLGKSGSGKSTLLNLCGGLDAPDSGEIIIKGRSSKKLFTGGLRQLPQHVRRICVPGIQHPERIHGRRQHRART